MKRLFPPAFFLLIALSDCSQEVSEQSTTDNINLSFSHSFPEDWLHKQHQFQSRSLDGVVRAANQGGPLHSQQIITELDLVIGKDSGPEEYILFVPTHIFTDDNDRILVYDGKRRSILVYDSGGNYIRSLGREGDGPGEFRSLPRLHLWNNGVLDAMVNNGRWQRWSISGELLFDRRPLDISASLSTSRYPAPTGDFSIIFDDPWHRNAQSDTTSGWWVYHKNVSDEPHQVITLLRSGGTEFVRGMFEGDNLGTITPYSQGLIIRQSPTNGFILSHADSAIFTRYDQAFNKQLEVVWDQMPVPLTKDEVIEAFNIYSPAPGWGQDQLIRWMKSLNWHETKPVIANIIIGTDERVWVELRDNEPWTNQLQAIRANSERSQFRYLVFTPTGEMEMAIVLPFMLKAASNTHLYQLVYDRETTPQVKRYKWRLEGFPVPN